MIIHRTADSDETVETVSGRIHEAIRDGDLSERVGTTEDGETTVTLNGRKFIIQLWEVA